MKLAAAQAPCRQPALHQAQLLPLLAEAAGVRASKGHGSSEQRVFIPLTIYLLSNSSRSCNPFTFLTSPSTEVLNFHFDLIFFPLLPFFPLPITKCLLPNEQALIKLFQPFNPRPQSTKVCSQSLLFHTGILSKGHLLLSTSLICIFLVFLWHSIPIFPFFFIQEDLEENR